jgi:8-oxo-dGTP diphosphatase
MKKRIMNNLERENSILELDENRENNTHGAVSVYLFNSERTHILLLFHRKLQAWLPPGGHMDNDLPQDAVVREVFEETGIDELSFINLDSGKLQIDSEDQQQLNIDEVINPVNLQIARPFAVVQENIPASRKEGEHIHIDCVYVGQIKNSNTKVTINLRESEDKQWFPLIIDEIANLETFPNIKAILRRLCTLMDL